MLLRLPVFVSAFAFVLAFIASPHQHLHRDSGIQHAHATAHESGHHHDGQPAHPEEHEGGTGSVVSITTFIAPAPTSVVAVAPVELPALSVVPSDTETGDLIASPEPRTHGPPLRALIGPRAPPLSAF
jgi:hypothetical protein